MAFSTHSTPKLTYTISEKDSVLILSASGPIVRENAAIIEEGYRETEKRTFKAIIFEISGVTEIDLVSLPIIGRLRTLVKARKGEMLTCGMSPAIQAFLDSRGLLRKDHLAPNLVEAFKRLRAFIATTSSSDAAP